MSNVSRIQLNADTRLDQLQNFALNLHDKDRVRSERTAEGLVLYASPKPTGLAKLKENLSNFVAFFTQPNRNRDLREAIATVLGRVGARADAAVLSSVKAALDVGLRGELKGASLKMLTAAVRAEDGMRGPSPSHLSERTLASVAETALAGLQSELPGDAGPVFSRQPPLAIDLSRLGADLARDFAKTASPADRDAFVLTGAPALREALVASMIEALPSAPDPQAKDTIEKTAMTILHSAAATLADGRMDAAGTITIGGKAFELVRKLGEGGFGEIFLYRKRGGTEEIAVKSPLRKGEENGLEDPKIRKERLEEVTAHRAVTGQPNVIALKGTVMADDGRLMIAMEYAAKKDVGALIRSMKQDQTSQAERNAIALTVLKDLATGMKGMHESADVVHSDFKPMNCFVCEGGVSKIADFGVSKRNVDYTYNDARAKNYKSDYLSPEYLKDLQSGERAFGRFRKDIGAGVMIVDSTKVDALANQLDDRFRGSGLSGEQRGVLQEAVRANLADVAHESGVDNTRHGKTGDVWALGATLFSLVYDRAPGKSGNFTHRFEKFGLDTTRRAIDTPVPDTGKADRYGLDTPALAGTSGSPELDDLLNAILHPDPRQRPSMDSVLSHPALRNLTPEGEHAARRNIEDLATR